VGEAESNGCQGKLVSTRQKRLREKGLAACGRRYRLLRVASKAYMYRIASIQMLLTLVIKHISKSSCSGHAKEGIAAVAGTRP